MLRGPDELNGFRLDRGSGVVRVLAAQTKFNTRGGVARRDIVGLATRTPIRRIPGRNRTKADILVHRLGQATVAVKDYSGRPFLIRQTLGRWLIRRETAAYRAADGLSGLPAFLGTCGAFALVLEWVEARPLSDFSDRQPPAGWFEKASGILDALHARGIALSDLHHRDLLVSPAGEVHIVDLATAWLLGSRPGRLRRRLFDRLRRLDHLALARMQARFSGDDPDQALARADESTAAWHRRGRRLKRLIGRLRSK
jgi:hypothetical protein